MDYRFKWIDGVNDPLEMAETVKANLEARGLDVELEIVEYNNEDNDDLPECIEVALIVFPRESDSDVP